MRGNETREHLKAIALQLFAEHGVEGVSVRDILAAAGQRSGGSLHYHFGGKDGLLRELIADGALLYDAARQRKLTALEAATSTPTLRDILRILAEPFAGDAPEAIVPPGYLTLLNSLMVEHYDAFIEGVEGRDLGYRRCIEHLRALLPEVPRELLNQRIRLMMLFLFSVASTRDRPAEGTVWQRFWQEPASRLTLIDCIEGMLRQPVSAETLAASAPRPPAA